MTALGPRPPPPPDTRTMPSRQWRAIGAGVSGGLSLKPSGWMTAKRSMFSGARRASGTLALSHTARLKSSLLQPEDAAVAACSGPRTISGSPPR